MGRRRNPRTLLSTIKQAEREKAAASARREGLLPRELVGDLKPGSVWIVADQEINLPDSRIEIKPDRVLHETRRVIIVQVGEYLRSRDPETILVVPTSASRGTNDLRRGDVELPPQCPGFTKSGVVAFPRLVQPLLKSDLQTCVGHLPDKTLQQVRRGIAKVLDLPRPAPVMAPRP